MRLINCETMRFECFFGKPFEPEDPNAPRIPPYAILSHTWEGDEICFPEYHDPSIIHLKPKSSHKVIEACAKAKRHGHKYIWIDNCCIDKSSSSELSEAINSMYEWYGRAQCCYVYLADYPGNQPVDNRVVIDNAILGACKWFKRGWTLQELIAPRKEVRFYNSEWQLMGTRLELSNNIFRVSKIPVDLLNGKLELFHYSVAQRMSWASARVTTREEDTAYYLLGLFNVNLPLFYGEGALKAFFRLQEAIMKEYNDLTLFAWQSLVKNSTFHTQKPGLIETYRGILATCPGEFALAGDIQSKATAQNPEFCMTNRGLKIQIPLSRSGGFIVLPLNCSRRSDASTNFGVYLIEYLGYIVRAHPDRLATIGLESTPSLFTKTNEPIYILKHIRIKSSNPVVSQAAVVNPTKAPVATTTSTKITATPGSYSTHSRATVEVVSRAHGTLG